MTAQNPAYQAVKFVKHFAKITACLCLLVACDKLNSPAEKQQALALQNQVEQMRLLKTLTRIIPASNFAFDPHFIRNNSEAAPIRDLLVGLMAFSADGKVEPAMAEQWFREDKKTWRFVLKKMKWSNGENVQAQDFVASWQRLSDPNNHSPLASYLIYMGVQNAKAVLAGQLPPNALGVSALDDETLLIRLEKENAQLPLMLAHIALLPTYHGEKPTADLIANGAYQIVQQTPTTLYLKARTQEIFFQHLEYQLQSNSDEQFKTAANKSQQNSYYLPRLCNYFYEFNFNQPQLQQLPIRQAIKAMLQPARIKGENGLINQHILPKTMREDELSHWKPAMVEQLFSQSGITPQNPLRLILAYDGQGQHPAIAKQIIRTLSQSDLIRITPKEVNWQELLALHDKQEYHLIRSGWCLDYPDPALFLWKFHSKSLDNKSGYKNSSVDKNLEQLYKMRLNDPLRATLIQQTAQLLEDDAAILPLFQYQRKIVVDSNLLGIDLNNSSEVIYSKDLLRKNSIKDNNESINRTATQ